MKIVADECVDEEIVLRLRDDGHEAGYVRVGIISAAIASHGNELLLSFRVRTEKAIRIRKAQ